MGKVYLLVSAGPGDHDLITEKGLKCIQEADAILYDRLVNEELLSCTKPVALINGGTTKDQRTVVSTLEKGAEKERIVNPCKILIGKVVKTRERIKWFESDTVLESLMTSEAN
ncbi:hypothetical protein D0469_13930 [Peribacillus saganii]|uniref:Tetrapyrrole methylase domain-containing protein n=1 Tax=Peribacillus saganii TaxID=2303992 RepID=A0A372LLE4_9BACI|nr:hypothetical protein D0469_13930 [Peribacillus saganii]